MSFIPRSSPPVASTTHHTSWTPCPATSPATASPAKVYSGHPSSVICFFPSGVSIVPSSPVIPSPTGSDPAARIGGQLPRHAPVHALSAAPWVSLSNTYAVIPSAVTTISPSAVSASMRSAPEEGASPYPPASEAGGAEVSAAPGEPQPARSIPRASAPIASVLRMISSFPRSAVKRHR